MILVAGSANLDFVVRASHIPQPGETVLGQSFTTYPGGKGANQAVAAARAGAASTHMLLGLGQDSFATPLEQSLTQAGVVQHIVRTQAATGTAFICVSDDGENAITVAPGANAELAPQHLPSLKGYSHLLMQLETPLATVQAYAAQARQQGVTVVLNAAPAQSLPSALLELVDILVVNEGELAAVAQHQGSIAECLQRLHVPTVVVTLGGRGCCARMGDQFVVQSAFPIKPVDTTGAGDTFCGTLVASLSQGLDMAQALLNASAAGALACTVAGAQSSIPTQAQVQTLVTTAPTLSAENSQALRHYCGL
ncbi:ribokinase [Curvibacter sp. CHRR-16]|uniref:ribokinase n=1 Tax=Curvibacter sp. CHRR-16 TaxID=2835872 RepID=UPI001BDA85B6|nr:ribokinase [Curvibacter sp. CHRR-16]MBT0571027.1 ribokinase [Curvibacter sp. CHRR-16]